MIKKGVGICLPRYTTSARGPYSQIKKFHGGLSGMGIVVISNVRLDIQRRAPRPKWLTIQSKVKKKKKREIIII